MLSDQNPHHEQFQNLLDKLQEEVDSLKSTIHKLEEDNGELRNKLKEIQDGQTDIYSEISESERLSMRHQVLGLISKIDNHLDESV